jgi:hypothetical protein
LNCVRKLLKNNREKEAVKAQTKKKLFILSFPHPTPPTHHTPAKQFEWKADDEGIVDDLARLG